MQMPESEAVLRLDSIHQKIREYEHTLTASERRYYLVLKFLNANRPLGLEETLIAKETIFQWLQYHEVHRCACHHENP